MARCYSAICAGLLVSLCTSGPVAAGTTVLPLPGIGALGTGTIGEGGRQPFGSSGVDDPLRGLGRQVNPLDAPIQGDLDRYRDDITPFPTLPPQPDLTPYLSPRPPMRPWLRRPGLGPGGIGARDIWLR